MWDLNTKTIADYSLYCTIDPKEYDYYKHHVYPHEIDVVGNINYGFSIYMKREIE